MILKPRFLSNAQVLRLHHRQIELFGGSHGLRDPGLLSSALAQPEMTSGGSFLHPDLFEMAAAYLFHLVQNHPFQDGNKRVGALVASVFLEVNGVEVIADEGEFEALVVATAQGQKTKEETAIFFRKNTLKP